MDRYDTIGADDLDGMRRLDASLPRRPRVSLLLPVEGGPCAPAIRAAVGSLQGQIYADWELLCLLPEPRQAAESVLDPVAARDSRIRLVPVEDSGTPALELALERATGEYGVLLDASSRLRPHALLLLARALALKDGAELIYADEDRIDARGHRSEHWFKPDWNPALLLAGDYIGALGAFRLDRARELGGFRERFGASQAWDLFLRLTQDVERASVVHVPHVLVHREASGSRAERRVDVVEAHLASSGVDGTVERVGASGVRVAYKLPHPAPAVRLIVATAAAHELVARCVGSVLQQTDYPRLRMTIVADTETLRDPDRRSVLETLTSDDRADLLAYPSRPFNYSWVHNWTVSRTEEEILCFVNDDVSVATPRWLELMVGHVLQPSVGAVGARLLYPDGTVQHGGVLLGVTGIAGRYHHGLPAESAGYHGRAVLDQDLSCVTAACMVIRRDAFDDVGGMDERLAIAFNDVDLSLRLTRAGWRIVLAAGAELVHGESTSLGAPDSAARREQFAAERQLMKSRWGDALKCDRHHNPNLDLRDPGALAFPPRVRYPWRDRK